MLDGACSREGQANRRVQSRVASVILLCPAGWLPISDPEEDFKHGGGSVQVYNSVRFEITCRICRAILDGALAAHRVRCGLLFIQTRVHSSRVGTATPPWVCPDSAGSAPSTLAGAGAVLFCRMILRRRIGRIQLTIRASGGRHRGSHRAAAVAHVFLIFGSSETRPRTCHNAGHDRLHVVENTVLTIGIREI